MADRLCVAFDHADNIGIEERLQMPAQALVFKRDGPVYDALGRRFWRATVRAAALPHPRAPQSERRWPGAGFSPLRAIVLSGDRVLHTKMMCSVAALTQPFAKRLRPLHSIMFGKPTHKLVPRGELPVLTF